jgi:hypothetical protein
MKSAEDYKQGDAISSKYNSINFEESFEELTHRNMGVSPKGFLV